MKLKRQKLDREEFLYVETGAKAIIILAHSRL